MKLLAIIAIAVLAASHLHAQTEAVIKTKSTDAITESIVVPSGKSITINSGASIINNGTATGFGGAGSTALNDLTDVTITTAATNDFLVKSSGDWVNLTPSNARTALGLGTLATQSGTISDYLTSATAASTYQPLNAKLTAISNLANASGVLTNNGSGTLSYTAMSYGGNGAADSGKLARYSPSGGIQSYSFTFIGDAGGSIELLAPLDLGLSSRSIYLPNANGTIISTGNLSAITTTGTIASGTWQGSIIAPAYLGTGSSITTKYLRGDGTWQTLSGGGDAVVSGTLDQFADVTQTATKTLAITESTTLAGGTHSGTNTGDQTTITGNAATATALQTGRAINGVTFDGTAAITVTAAAGTLSGSTLASGVTSSSLTSLGTITSGVWTATAIADSYIASAATWNDKEAALTFSTGLTRAVNTITVNTSQNIATLSNLTSNGFVKTSGGTGSLSVEATIPLANGGTAAALTDPNADRLLFWDDSAGAVTWLTAGSGLTITDTTITASGGGGSGETSVYTTGTQSLTTTSLVDVTDLSFAVASGTRYHFKFVINYLTSAVGEGIGFAINGPSASVVSAEVKIFQSTAAGRFEHVTAYETAVTNTTGITAGSYATVEGFVITTASGTLTLRGKTENGAGATSTIGAGSWGVITAAPAP